MAPMSRSVQITEGLVWWIADFINCVAVNMDLSLTRLFIAGKVFSMKGFVVYGY